MNLIPLKIRSHLVPFFFHESKGNEVAYLNKKVKTVVFSPTVSSMGKFIRLLLEKADKPIDCKHLNLYLEVADVGNKKEYQGSIYKMTKSGSCFLKLPEKVNEDINDIFEDMFRMAFVNYIDGCIESSHKSVVVTAIDRWITKYDLLEVGYSSDTLRRLYYREKNKGCLSRFHIGKNSSSLLNN